MNPNDSNQANNASEPSAQQPFATQPEPQPQQLHPAQQPIVAGGSGGFKGRKFGKFGLVAIVAGAVIVFAGGSAAAYFGYVVPNKPENIWKKSMTRTAQGYDTLVNYESSNKSHTSMTLKGSFKAAGDFATDGNIDIESDQNNASIKFDFGALTTRVNVEARAIDSANSTNPDVYFKATGLKGLSSELGDYGQMLEEIDGKWIGVDHTFLDNIESGALTGEESSSSAKTSPMTADDYVQVMKAVGEVNRQYLFTDDSSKAVLTVVKNVGKEKQDGRSVYHYTVGLDKQHTKDYANAMVDRLQNTPLTKLFPDQKLRDVIDMNGLVSSIDKYDSADTADVYVDMGTKLIRSVRITDKSDKKTYFEVKMPYTGGDVLPMIMTLDGPDEATGLNGNVTLKISYNGKKDTADLDATFDIPTGSEKGDKSHETGSMKLTATGSTQAIKVDKPSNATSLNELLGGLLGGGSTELLNSVDSGAGTTDYSNLLGNILSI